MKGRKLNDKGKVLLIVLILIIISVLFIPSLFYKIKGEVVGIEKGVVFIEDTSGKKWEYKSNEKFGLGQEVELKVYDNADEFSDTDVIVGIE